ncbi:hypothetical protein GCM10009696_29850 [Kocuria himachalensis]
MVLLLLVPAVPDRPGAPLREPIGGSPQHRGHGHGQGQGEGEGHETEDRSEDLRPVKVAPARSCRTV